MLGTQLVGGGILSVCKRCEKPFVSYTQNHPGYKIAKTCPICLDVVQNRPSVVQEREELYRLDNVKVCGLPGNWEVLLNPNKSDEDYNCYKIDEKGSKFGASWNGRFVIYADEKIEIDDYVCLREMKTVHKRIHKQPEIEGQEKVEDEILFEDRPYLVLEKSRLTDLTAYDKEYQLIYAESYSKTTLKGLGRQFHSTITDNSIRSWCISGGARSGRFSTTGILAIVDRQHPVVVHGTGDIVFKETYPRNAEVKFVEDLLEEEEE